MRGGAEGDALAEGERDGLSDGLTLGLTDGDTEGLTLAEGDNEADGEMDALPAKGLTAIRNPTIASFSTAMLAVFVPDAPALAWVV